MSGLAQPGGGGESGEGWGPGGCQKHARGLLHAILEHASPVLGSGLGKIGQAGDQGIVNSPGAPRGAGHEFRSRALGAGCWSRP